MTKTKTDDIRPDHSGLALHALTIIFVSYNSAAIFLKSLPHLVDEPAFRILIVDNNSSDHTPAWVKEHFPGVEMVEAGQNLGYGRAANVGIRKTHTRFALLLNPDVLSTPLGIEKLLQHARNDESDTAIWAPATNLRDFSGAPPAQVEWVSGGIMLFDVEKIKQVGLFDENIFLFAEETDLCERVIKAGFRIKLCHDIFFEHLAGQSSSASEQIEYMRWWHFGWSQCYRIEKNGHANLVRNPYMKYLGYWLHSHTATSHSKRKKWEAKSAGALAYIRGERAFRADGTPQFS